MRPLSLSLIALVVLLVVAGIGVGLMPWTPASQHVEQRIPDAQISR